MSPGAPLFRPGVGPAARPFLVCAAWSAVVAVFCWPLLAGHASLLYGDNLSHSLALQAQQARLLQGDGWRFWWPEEAGGFPRYAEATGAFFHPLNLLWFRWLEPLRGHDLLFVAQLFLLGVGMQTGCRLLGVRSLPTIAVVSAVVVSPLAVNMSVNAVYLGATAAAAWTWAAYERWMQRADGLGFAGLVTAACLLVLASYPPLTYGTLLLLGIASCLRLALERRDVVRRAGGLTAAVACGFLLAAPQLLPLAELTGQSVRQSGVAMQASAPFFASLRGIVLSTDPALFARPVGIAPGLGSVIGVLGLALLPLSRDPRVLSAAPAVLIGLDLAAGPHGVLHPLLRDALPGLRQLRHTLPLGWSVLPVLGLVVAGALAAGPTATPLRRGLAAAALGLGLAAAFGLRPIRWLGAGPAWLLLAAVGLELAVLRPGLRPFHDGALLAEPRPVAQFLRDAQRAEPGTTSVLEETPAHHRLFGTVLFGDPRSPAYTEALRYCMQALCPSFHLVDGVSQAAAHEALPLARFEAALDTLERERTGRSDRADGMRLMDRLRWRHVIVPPGTDAPAFARDLELVLHDPVSGVRVLENLHIRPRIEWWPRAILVDGVREAVRQLPQAGDALLVERLPDGGHPRWLPASLRAALDRLPFTPHERHGRLALDAPADGFAFVPIPSYPGWRAFVDGAPAPLRPAHVLGQAFPVRAGRHEIELVFTPYSFALGVCVAAATLLLLAFAALGLSARRRRARAPARTAAGAPPPAGTSRTEDRASPRTAARARADS